MYSQPSDYLVSGASQEMIIRYHQKCQNEKLFTFFIIFSSLWLRVQSRGYQKVQQLEENQNTDCLNSGEFGMAAGGMECFN